MGRLASSSLWPWRKGRRSPPLASAHLRRDLGLLPLDVPRTHWDYL